MKKLHLLGAACTAILLNYSNSALATTIDFGPSFGAPATSEGLTNQLSSYGAIFSSSSPNGVVWFGDAPTVGSYSYVIGAGFTGGLLDTSPIRIDFVDPVSGDPTTVTINPASNCIC